VSGRGQKSRALPVHLSHLLRGLCRSVFHGERLWFLPLPASAAAALARVRLGAASAILGRFACRVVRVPWRHRILVQPCSCVLDGLLDGLGGRLRSSSPGFREVGVSAGSSPWPQGLLGVLVPSPGPRCVRACRRDLRIPPGHCWQWPVPPPTLRVVPFPHARRASPANASHRAALPSAAAVFGRRGRRYVVPPGHRPGWANDGCCIRGASWAPHDRFFHPFCCRRPTRSTDSPLRRRRHRGSPASAGAVPSLAPWLERPRWSAGGRARSAPSFFASRGLRAQRTRPRTPSIRRHRSLAPQPPASLPPPRRSLIPSSRWRAARSLTRALPKSYCH